MNILDKRFKYTPACQTDIRKTFARARKELEAKQPPRAPVTPIDKRRKA